MKKIWIIIACIFVLVIGFGVIYITDVFDWRTVWIALTEENYDGTSTNHKQYGNAVGYGGDYKKGSRITIEAKANEGYNFYYWTLNGEVVSTEEKYEINVKERATYVAVFGVGTVKKVNNTIVVADDKNAEIVVDELEGKYRLQHTGDDLKKGYWYEGEDNGYNQELTSNSLIKANYNTKEVKEYKFHEAVDMLYVFFENSAAYYNYTLNPTMENIISMKNNGVVEYGYFTELGMPSNGNVTKKINKDLDEGGFLVVTPVYYYNNLKGLIFTEGKKYITGSQTYIYNCMLQNILYDISIELS